MKPIKILMPTIFVLVALATQAQVKVGSNPTNIDPNSVFEVEATNGSKVTVNKATGVLRLENAFAPLKWPEALHPFTFLVVDNQTREIKQLTEALSTTKPFNYIRYVLKDVDGDFISSFDTKIPFKDYIVTVVGASFSEMLEGAAAHNVRAVVDNPVNTGNEEYTLFNQTWLLQADYPLVKPVNSVSGVWSIDVLVVSKYFCSYKGIIEHSMNKQSAGVAATKPAGL